MHPLLSIRPSAKVDIILVYSEDDHGLKGRYPREEQGKGWSP